MGEIFKNFKNKGAPSQSRPLHEANDPFAMFKKLSAEQEKQVAPDNVKSSSVRQWAFQSDSESNVSIPVVQRGTDTIIRKLKGRAVSVLPPATSLTSIQSVRRNLMSTA